MQRINTCIFASFNITPKLTPHEQRLWIFLNEAFYHHYIGVAKVKNFADDIIADIHSIWSEVFRIEEPMLTLKHIAELGEERSHSFHAF